MGICSEIRVCTLTWPFPFLVRLGWATARTPNPRPEDARARVYLLRGNGIVFSNGLGILCRQLREMGVWAEDLRCVGDLWAYRQLIAEHRAGRLRGPVIFVGHSCGGRYSVFTARKLQRAGIQVHLLVCLDVAMPPEVPANVDRAVSIYLTRRRIYPARPLRSAPGSPAVIENIDLNGKDSPVRANWLCHLNITDSVGVRALVMERILRVV